jgi:hypothetical protein
MPWTGLALIVALLLLWVWLRIARKTKQPELQLSSRKNLLDKEARALKLKLAEALGEEFDIYPQVRLAELLVINAAGDKTSQQMRQQIEASSVDYVLCDKHSGQISCVVMLSRHDKVGSRQQFVRDVCERSELPFILIDAHNEIDGKDLRRRIVTMLEPTINLDETAETDVKVYLEPGQSDAPPEQKVTHEQPQQWYH